MPRDSSDCQNSLRDPESDPYRHEDLSKYPKWWRKNIRFFRGAGLRPYVPPRFSDGEYTTPLIRELSSELGVEIQLRSINPHIKGKWDVVVDGQAITTIERKRVREGYSLYLITSDEFETHIREYVD